MCGEKCIRLGRYGSDGGSPPRVRGKAVVTRLRSRTVGITPACAGKRGANLYSGSCAEDHPRVCGEKCNANFRSMMDYGSPPRVRGKAMVPAEILLLIRITPACAGKSALTVQRSLSSRDHPRVCGEKSTALREHSLPKGSPPRVRGKAAAGRHAVGAGGITPACAGKRAPA